MDRFRTPPQQLLLLLNIYCTVMKTGSYTPERRLQVIPLDSSILAPRNEFPGCKSTVVPARDHCVWMCGFRVDWKPDLTYAMYNKSFQLRTLTGNFTRIR